MIAYIKGTIVDVSDDSIVVDHNGIGFNIFVPNGYAYTMGDEVKIHTYTNVKEDAFNLFGFDGKDQLELFKMLISVNGIGPKGGLAILSVLNADALRLAIFNEDAAAIAKAPGVGKKTAERVILELKGKVKLSDVEQMPSLSTTLSSVSLAGMDSQRKDAIEALTALGYSSTEAVKAVSKVEITEDMSADIILRKSLQYLF